MFYYLIIMWDKNVEFELYLVYKNGCYGFRYGIYCLYIYIYVFYVILKKIKGIYLRNKNDRVIVSFLNRY